MWWRQNPIGRPSTRHSSRCGVPPRQPPDRTGRPPRQRARCPLPVSRRPRFRPSAGTLALRTSSGMPDTATDHRPKIARLPQYAARTGAGSSDAVSMSEVTSHSLERGAGTLGPRTPMCSRHIPWPAGEGGRCQPPITKSALRTPAENYFVITLEIYSPFRREPFHRNRAGYPAGSVRTYSCPRPPAAPPPTCHHRPDSESAAISQARFVAVPSQLRWRRRSSPRSTRWRRSGHGDLANSAPIAATVAATFSRPVR